MSEALKSPADPLAAFERERGRLFGIAYRMLGSVAEAEDVLQDAWLRWQGVDHSQVENPSAYLVRLVTRLSIDTLGAARNRLTDYVGPWLPEPLVGRRAQRNLSEDPAALQELADDLSTAFLLMLERLTPVERAVFLLRESFDFSYKEIAEIVGKTEENCRQIDRRARKHLEEHRRSAPADPAEHDRLVEGFLRAVRDGDMDGMVALLAQDATLYSDGGGKVKAAQKPIHGAESIALFLYNIRRQAVRMQVDFELRPTIVNGRAGFMTLAEGRLYNVFALDTEPGKIRGVYVVANPDKLANIEI